MSNLSVLTIIADHRFSKLLKDYEQLKETMSFLEQSIRLKCGYAFDLVWYKEHIEPESFAYHSEEIQQRSHAKLRAQIEATYPKHIKELEKHEEWTYGFDSAHVHFSSQIMRIIYAEDYVVNFYDNVRPENMDDYFNSAFYTSGEDDEFLSERCAREHIWNLPSLVCAFYYPKARIERKDSAEFHALLLTQKLNPYERRFRRQNVQETKEADEAVLFATTPALQNNRFDTIMKEFHFLKKKLAYVEWFIESKYGYADDLVAYARKSDEDRRTIPGLHERLLETEEKWPDDIEDLYEMGNSQHGMNSGYLALSRMLLGILNAREETEEWRHLNPDEPQADNDVERRTQEYVDSYPELYT